MPLAFSKNWIAAPAALALIKPITQAHMPSRYRQSPIEARSGHSRPSTRRSVIYATILLPSTPSPRTLGFVMISTFRRVFDLSTRAIAFKLHPRPCHDDTPARHSKETACAYLTHKLLVLKILNFLIDLKSSTCRQRGRISLIDVTDWRAARVHWCAYILGRTLGDLEEANMTLVLDESASCASNKSNAVHALLVDGTPAPYP